MSTRGRKPKPVPLRRLQGGRATSHRATPPETPMAPLPEAPPTWLKAEARAEWTRMLPYARIGVVTDADLQSFTAYCYYVGEWLLAVQRMEARGFAIDIPHHNKDGQITHVGTHYLAAGTERDRALDKWTRLAGELGFTPVSRARAGAAGDGEKGSSPAARMFQLIENARTDSGSKKA